jgi:hypothetical protein
MKLIRPFLFLLALGYVIAPGKVLAQSSLPDFSATIRSGKVIISWYNGLDSVIQISIQRSPDSLKGFKTIVTLPDPTAVTNGYLDNKAPNTTQFYKLYVQQSRGRYFVTKAFKPVLDTARVVKAAPAREPIKSPAGGPSQPPVQGASPGLSSTDSDVTGSMKLAAANPTGFRLINGKNVVDSARVGVPDLSNAFTPSVFVYTNKEGNVVIALPESRSSVFSIKFYRENGEPVFTLNKIKEPLLTLDKSNFFHAGWFRFELYENDKLKEKYKFYLPKERQ